MTDKIIRGAGALQYGTQFGGLVNFNIKKPIENKTLELKSVLGLNPLPFL